eukprot:CAMPEP_0177666806 /NCGR_PEP_ID=MMETSP0447-20121125/21781_1 /TAXON_ID=0 /ORGANISM="Stygamoeba regulata, Strain BSH-02190019" /LENGTH=529 /DNA_ID=CAMNT_0019172985 /DNA_START=190 /DNA_END=1776 /DNA_ORIENTATION=-
MDIKQYQRLMTLKYQGASDRERDQQQRALVRKDLIPPVHHNADDEFGLAARGFVYDPSIRNHPHMIVHLAPLHFVHVLDLNTMFVKMLSGPLTFTTTFHERVIYGPKPMVTVPPGHYCVIQHPVRVRRDRDVSSFAEDSLPAAAAPAAPTDAASCGSPLRRSVGVAVSSPPNSPVQSRRIRAGSAQSQSLSRSGTTLTSAAAAASSSSSSSASNSTSASSSISKNVSALLAAGSLLASPVGSAYEIETDQYGQAVIDRNVLQVRTEQPPFPLYPGEVLLDASVRPLPFVPADHALRLRAEVDLVDEQTNVNKPTHRRAAEEWAFRGPRVFVPDSRICVCGVISPLLLKPQQGVALESTLDHVDDTGVLRIAGERWLVIREGNLLTGVYQKVLRIQDGIVLSKQKALHLRAQITFDDQVVGVRRAAGEEWLLTYKECAVYIPPPEVTVISEQPLHSLKRGEFCYLSNPRDSDTNELLKGRRVLLRGESNFYLKPGEVISPKYKSVVLNNDMAIECRVDAPYEGRVPGSRW